jgi:uncharacterized protein
MQRSLRRKERGMEESGTRELLQRGEYGVLSTCGADGVPYGVPLSYCLVNGAIYFHCAPEGHKVETIAGCGTVSFCVVGETEVLPDQFATRYQSVIVTGPAAEVFHEEKQQALEGLVEKYSPGYRREGLKYIEAMEKRTKVFRIDIQALSGKARP